MEKIVNKGGRPRKLFTEEQWKEFENLCAIQCTKIEICAWFGIEDDTLEKLLKEHYDKGFSEVFRLKRGKGLTSLRRRQFQLAETNPAMAIFLGKNYLNQSDRQDIDVKQQVQTQFDVSKLTNDDLAQLSNMLKRMHKQVEVAEEVKVEKEQ